MLKTARPALLLLLLTLLCLLPAAAAADKTVTLTFTGDVTLGGEAGPQRA